MPGSFKTEMNVFFPILDSAKAEDALKTLANVYSLGDTDLDREV